MSAHPADSWAQEAQRQQALLRVLWRDDSPAALAPWVPPGTQFVRGLQAHQAHAGAAATRALAAAFPTVHQLLGPQPFAALARTLWAHAPPTHGDMARWGEALPAFMAAAPELAGEPYLADLARLEWAVHRAATATDETPVPLTLQQLALCEPSALVLLRLLPRAGTALVASAHPVVSLWLAHQALPTVAQVDAEGGAEEDAEGDAEAESEAEAEDGSASASAARLPTGSGPGSEFGSADTFAAARAALAQQRAETALVWRTGWRVQVAALGTAEAAFAQQVLQGVALGAALQGLAPGPAAPLAAGAGFDFQAWLLLQLQRGWLAGAAQLREPAHQPISPSNTHHRIHPSPADVPPATAPRAGRYSQPT